LDEQLIVCKAKVLGARVTEANRRYWASLEVDAAILQAAGVLDYEKVLVVNIDEGHRFETYVRAAPSGSGKVVLAGGAATLGKAGDEIGFLVFAVVPVERAAGWKPRVVIVNSDNTIRSATNGDP
jgi:aspartate 1-decarboxylase